MKGKIIGQDEAVEEIARAVRRSRAGISNPNRPLGSFIFLGPTGVGKTETAKVLASEVFEDEDALIRVDMSEFMERHNVSRLIGAPAGYVGFGEGGQLTEAVRRKPYSVVLFDEIEKANPDVFNILLQILEDGQLTDAMGKKVNFRNTIIIMTSNLGMQELNLQDAKIGFADKEEKVDEQEKLQKRIRAHQRRRTGKFKDEFRPELLNRIDKIVVFKPLGLQERKKDFPAENKRAPGALAGTRDIQLKVSAPVVKFIADKVLIPPRARVLCEKFAGNGGGRCRGKNYFGKRGGRAHSFSRFKKDAVVISIKRNSRPQPVLV